MYVHLRQNPSRGKIKKSLIWSDNGGDGKMNRIWRIEDINIVCVRHSQPGSQEMMHLSTISDSRGKKSTPFAQNHKEQITPVLI